MSEVSSPAEAAIFKFTFKRQMWIYTSLQNFSIIISIFEIFD